MSYANARKLSAHEMLVLCDVQVHAGQRASTRRALIQSFVQAMQERNRCTQEVADIIFEWHQVDVNEIRLPADIN